MTTLSKIQLQDLIKQHLWFLVEEYNLKYNAEENTFSDEKICVFIEDLDYRDPPAICIWLKSEPPFTKVSLYHIFSTTPNLYSEQEEFRKRSNAFKKQAPNLIKNQENLQELVIKEQKRIFLLLCKAYRTSPNNFFENDYNLRNYKEYYDYIKEEEPDWDAEKDYELFLSSK